MPVSEAYRIVDAGASECLSIASESKQSPEGTGTHQEIATSLRSSQHDMSPDVSFVDN
jgi:hypothetical protein